MSIFNPSGNSSQSISGVFSPVSEKIEVLPESCPIGISGNNTTVMFTAPSGVIEIADLPQAIDPICVTSCISVVPVVQHTDSNTITPLYGSSIVLPVFETQLESDSKKRFGLVSNPHLSNTDWATATQNGAIKIDVERDSTVPFFEDLTFALGIEKPEPPEATQYDLDKDGFVGFSDFLIFSEIYATGNYDPLIDFNFDGSVDIADFLLFSENFNTAVPVPLGYCDFDPVAATVCYDCDTGELESILVTFCGNTMVSGSNLQIVTQDGESFFPIADGELTQPSNILEDPFAGGIGGPIDSIESNLVGVIVRSCTGNERDNFSQKEIISPLNLCDFQCMEYGHCEDSLLVAGTDQPLFNATFTLSNNIDIGPFAFIPGDPNSMDDLQVVEIPNLQFWNSPPFGSTSDPCRLLREDDGSNVSVVFLFSAVCETDGSLTLYSTLYMQNGVDLAWSTKLCEMVSDGQTIVMELTQSNVDASIVNCVPPNINNLVLTISNA